MQLNIGSYLAAVLDDPENSDLFPVYEIYASNYNSSSGFDPRDAERTFAGFTYVLPFGPVTYKRQVKTAVTIDKTVKKQINSVSIEFSNVDKDVDGFRYMARYVNSNVIEGKKLVVRLLSFSAAQTIGNDSSVLANSIVLFAGRCDKPDAFNREHGTISAKQYIGNVEAQIPRYQFQQHCTVKFKGPECLGTELLSEKSAEFQAGTVCNKTEEKCIFYSNRKFFQGTRIIQITSSFVHQGHQGLLSKLLQYGAFGLVGRLLGPKRSKVTVNNSIHDGTPYGSVIPIILGRWYKRGIALQFQDIGTSINFKVAWCRGKISDIINLRNESPGFTQPIGATKHLGEYGGQGTQTADTVFPDHSFHSRLAYTTGYCNGSDIESEDPAPDLSSIVAGIVPDQIYFDVDHDGTGKLAAGTGGVTTPGSSTSPPGTPAADFDAAITPRLPKSYVKLEDAAGPTITALVGVGGLYNIAATFHQAGPIQTDSPSYGVGGKVGTLPAPLGGTLDLKNKITINGWAVTGDGQTLACRNGIDGESGSNFVIMTNGGAKASLFIDGNDYEVIANVAGISAGTYVMVTAVRDGSFLGVYINACLAGSRNDLPLSEIDYSQWDGYLSGNDTWKIGFAGPAGHVGEIEFGGITSHVSFYNYAWQPQDVANVHASAVNVPVGCPGEDWTDNPVDHVRWLLTEPSALNFPANMVDDFESAYTAAYNCGAIKDETNAERGLLPNTEVSKAGVDYQRYTSTGLLGPLSFQSTRTQIPAGVPARSLMNVGSGGNRIGEYEFYNPSSPPTSLSTLIAYRKRYTNNMELGQARKVIDVINDQIFPTFGGFFRWNAKEQIIIDSERPADWTKLRIASTVGATQLIVNDVLPWKNKLGSPYLLEGKLHIGGTLSEVRPVTAAVYSSLGDEITLAASASGGPTAVASGATLSGGSPTVKSFATVTITGSLANGSSITVTVDGIACVLGLVPGESSSTIGHRMACVINADPILREYIEAHAADNMVTIYAKIGILTLSSALEETHEEGTELTRVLGSFAGRALTYADTTRANILDGTFEWPEATRQPLINQIKATHREAIQDFGEFPIVVNDDPSQEETLQVNPHEPDHSGIDNYNTNARRCNSLLNKFRAGDKFYKLSTIGRALLLDEGDVICASDDSGNYRNVLMRIEDAQIRNNVEISFVSRLYSRDQFSDLIPDPADVTIESGLPGFEQTPPVIAFDKVGFAPNGLVQSTDGAAGITTIRGGVIFGNSPYAQYAKIRLIKRGGVVVDESINGHLDKTSDGKGVFEFPASVDGLYTVAARACNQWGCSAEVTADIIIGFGTLFGIAKQGGILISKQGGTLMEQQHG